MGSQLVRFLTAPPAAVTGAAVWTGAALVTSALPSAGRVRSLRRRATLLTWLVVAGLVTVAMALLGAASAPASGSGSGAMSATSAALIAASASLAALTSVPLLGGLRAATRVFVPAPGTPTPPVLRASSAHPLLAIPVQVAALAAALYALLYADLAGVARSPATPITFVAVTGLAVALLDTVRYGRLRAHTTRSVLPPGATAGRPTVTRAAPVRHRRPEPRSADTRLPSASNGGAEWPHFGRDTTSVEVELAILRAGDERVPFIGGEDERRPARVL